MKAYRMFVPGKVRGQGRPRFYRRGEIVGTYKPDKDAAYEDLIGWSWRQQQGDLCFGGALYLGVQAIFPRPAGHYRQKGYLSAAGERKPHHTQRPDLDNIVKAVKDGLSGVAYKDDVQIIKIVADKSWGISQSDNGGLYVTLEPVDP